MRNLLFSRNVPGEGRFSEAHPPAHDILRCWLFPGFSRGRSAPACAGNSVTSGWGSAALGKPLGPLRRGRELVFQAFQGSVSGLSVVVAEFVRDARAGTRDWLR
jgi:hypothetical protein